MKKFFAVLAIAAAITACNNGGEGDKTGADSIKPVDSTPAVTTPTVNADSLRIADSTRIADSIKNASKMAPKKDEKKK